MNTPTPSSPPALWLIAGLLLGLSMTIAAAGKAITSEVRKSNTLYLCTESWKLGIYDNKTCQQILEPSKKADAA
ncbi:Putative membrane protein [Sphingopyxis fribergensis]|uniref:Putative membrane protein n=1 Tax=Sphingopyxis fribergensis TaxID=1515612 RepID=A0A0A7PHI8_9SPHN|nr:hypothetical protein [Sphingopyxis fribergensis]AJA07412.1 Putative membrane protein [Sphingopyxis fribergensis]